MTRDKSPNKKDASSARAWRLAHGLTVAELAALTGYSVEAIYVFERGEREVQPWSWRRYRMACAGAERELTTEPFTWRAA